MIAASGTASRAASAYPRPGDLTHRPAHQRRGAVRVGDHDDNRSRREDQRSQPDTQQQQYCRDDADAGQGDPPDEGRPGGAMQPLDEPDHAGPARATRGEGDQESEEHAESQLFGEPDRRRFPVPAVALLRNAEILQVIDRYRAMAVDLGDPVHLVEFGELGVGEQQVAVAGLAAFEVGPEMREFARQPAIDVEKPQLQAAHDVLFVQAEFVREVQRRGADAVGFHHRPYTGLCGEQV